MTRVAMLSDPTRGLGNLAEPECRRVNAALALAAEPVVEGIFEVSVTATVTTKVGSVVTSGSSGIDGYRPEPALSSDSACQAISAAFCSASLRASSARSAKILI